MTKLYPLYGAAIIAISLAAAGCNSTSEKDDKQEATVETVLPSKEAEVTTMMLEPTIFSHEIVSNGKVSAHSYADLQFSTDAVIDKVLVKNGDRVTAGQPLATLDVYKLRNTLEQNSNDVSSAQLEMQDVLIGQGYDPSQMDKIPVEVVKLARLRSGLDKAEKVLAATEREIADATLTAPFSGVVANLFQKAGNRPDGSTPFCRIVETGNMDVDFSVLESEIAVLNRGDAIEVRPFSSSEVYQGRVTEVNPLVDEDGLVKVRASVDGGGQLFDGMNVKVSVKRALDRQLVIPKSAVVLRSGKQVVFTLDKGSKARWNYVHTGLENMTEYVVDDGLSAGDEVIISGNVNLAHEAPVKKIAQ
ncbi:MAG: efflux RND transporter periplasmic adaptor subunit [Bacteroidales bacterium]|nr:efflux RND transporter periplasmic adaptor subunit [Bacteroidales bacterium]